MKAVPKPVSRIKGVGRLAQTLALSLVFGLSSATAAFAQLEGGEGGAPPEGAKGLFFQQLERPTESINTGLRYWIELKRGGTVSRVTNKTQFKTGDSIRFHVRSNIDGYAYILLSCGSREERSVLFPDPHVVENNKLERGKEYALPSDGYLTFDENPGTEKLTLLLSRSPINAEAYLSRPQRQVTMIASAQTGSKDLVPAKIYVSYNTPRVDYAPVIKDEPKADPTPVKIAEKPSDKGDKKDDGQDAKGKDKKGKKPVKTAVKPKTDNRTKVASSSGSSTPKVHRTPDTGSSNANNGASGVSNGAGDGREDEGTTTVVSKQSSGVLHVDVALDHRD
ncbi:MAG TPA: DUF4384 domain-containing protein [Candidatus Obscuribacter sp.]|nr:DUF4384 domain-containing protein [Candidatus Obscuribacter sp.]